MTDRAQDNLAASPASGILDQGDVPGAARRQLIVVALALLLVLLAATLFLEYQNAAPDAPIVAESTLGRLGVWMAEQSALEAPISLLGQFTRAQAVAAGQSSLDVATVNNAMRGGLSIYLLTTVALGIIGLVGLLRAANWTRPVLLAALILLDVLVFVLPPLDGNDVQLRLLVGIVLLLAIMLYAPGKVSRLMGFFVVISSLLVAWEAFKAFGAAVNYQITLPQSGWTYRSYETLDEGLAALQAGDIPALIIDQNDIEDLLAPHPNDDGVDAAALPYPTLRYLLRLENDTRILGLPIIPAFPGRLTVVVNEGDVARWSHTNDLMAQQPGTVKASFAEERFLAQERKLVLLDLRITNDTNMPHLQSMALALLQPARRNGEFLLIRILGQAALFTWAEAGLGFISGALLGFLLGTVFAHSRLLERGLLPYVVASQTIPILAVAPMVVIWLGASPASVAVIAAYLTFFPVTINTLRGLTSPHPNALELMQSYAANWWTVLWKLRFPAALPYVFTALKVSATASVVGAIIGELPSGIADGLGRAILNFNQYYSSDPARLWAAILVAAVVGISSFLIVSLIERIVLGRRVQAQ
ncbi:MAG: ABC transporter permease [Anaerolineae bacterium]|nr:ABC transporter permease [Anaerolineae bacterium]